MGRCDPENPYKREEGADTAARGCSMARRADGRRAQPRARTDGRPRGAGEGKRTVPRASRRKRSPWGPVGMSRLWDRQTTRLCCVSAAPGPAAPIFWGRVGNNRNASSLSPGARASPSGAHARVSPLSACRGTAPSCEPEPSVQLHGVGGPPSSTVASSLETTCKDPICKKVTFTGSGWT